VHTPPEFQRARPNPGSLQSEAHSGPNNAKNPLTSQKREMRGFLCSRHPTRGLPIGYYA